MQIVVKCWTPEHYDAVTHAVIEFDLILVDNLLAKLALANHLKTEPLGDSFMGLEFNSYEPTFIDACPDDIGLTEEEFDELLDDGYHILPATMDDHKWEECSMRPCMQMIMAGNAHPENAPNGRVYWCAYDKHGDAGCRAETYSLYERDLREIKEMLTCPSTSSK